MIGILIFAGTALVLGSALVLVDSKLNKNDSRVEEITELLPGLNCGTCGKSGCRGMAEAIIENPKEYKNCRPLRKEKLTNLENYLREKKMID